jgi:hypothetical protein
MDFVPRGMDHTTLFQGAEEARIKLALLGGVGSATGGAASGTKARFVGTASKKPACVADAEKRAAITKKLFEQKQLEEGVELDYDEDFVNLVHEVYLTATKPYPPTIGKSVSKRERDETHEDSPDYMYSEMEFISLAVVLQRIKKKFGRPGKNFSGEEGVLQNMGGSFFDLGSGTGKMLLGAACLHPFATIIGVEKLEGLHNVSLELLESWEKAKNALPAELEYKADGDGGEPQEVENLHGDFMDDQLVDWTSGDVVYINCTSFTPETMAQISEVALGMRVGSFAITVTAMLGGDGFLLVDTDYLDFSWGRATVFFQQRKALEEDEESEFKDEEEEEEAEKEEDAEEEKKEEGNGGGEEEKETAVSEDVAVPEVAGEEVEAGGDGGGEETEAEAVAAAEEDP